MGVLAIRAVELVVYIRAPDCFWKLRCRGPADHVNIRMPETMVSELPLSWALEPGSRILMNLCGFGVPDQNLKFCSSRFKIQDSRFLGNFS